MAESMRPKFLRTLTLSPGGKSVKAEGPIGLDGSEDEAYIAVWITQDKVTGTGMGEMEENDFNAAREAADKRRRKRGETSEPIEPADAVEDGPRWTIPVQVRESALKAGSAKGEAWLLLREKNGDEFRIMWNGSVTLAEEQHSGQP